MEPAIPRDQLSPVVAGIFAALDEDRARIRQLKVELAMTNDPTRAFELQRAIVTAKLMQSGTLYRWLLGFGDKVEVLAPESLRRAIAWQAYSVTDYYEDIYEEADDE